VIAFIVLPVPGIRLDERPPDVVGQNQRLLRAQPYVGIGDEGRMAMSMTMIMAMFLGVPVFMAGVSGFAAVVRGMLRIRTVPSAVLAAGRKGRPVAGQPDQ